ncbi:MAG: DUF938 domain-containing protein [Myxococcota bacterium]
MDPRLDFPATGRNRNALTDVLRGRLGEAATLLEIASGSGQHVAWFAARWPGVRFVPSDPDPRHRASITAWTRELPNVAPPLDLDVLRGPWPLDAPVDHLFCANLIHVAPLACTEALFGHGSHAVREGGTLWLYGPFLQSDVPTAPSNLQFDASLRRRDPTWGIRDLDEVTRLASAAGFLRHEVVAMPANNLFVAFVRQS